MILCQEKQRKLAKVTPRVKPSYPGRIVTTKPTRSRPQTLATKLAAEDAALDAESLDTEMRFPLSLGHTIVYRR